MMLLLLLWTCGWLLNLSGCAIINGRIVLQDIFLCLLLSPLSLILIVFHLSSIIEDSDNIVLWSRK